MRYTLDELGEADVVYALRMQHERMSEAWVPSLREYAACYQINARRLRPRQLLMHPGPVNRGVELSGEVVDSPQALITAQVEAGVVVRMAVLYELLAGSRARRDSEPQLADAARPRRSPHEHRARWRRARAARRPAAARRARARPARGHRRAAATCSCATGEIAELAAPGTLERATAGAEAVDGAGTATLLPAFFDPHVHLRTPGQEHKEDLETGTRAAAAGGFCAVIAMPNTDPVLDSAPLLRSLRDAAARDARVPVGFLRGDHPRPGRASELTEMAELREEGALGFTDDGRPVASAGMLRKALQYQRLCGGVLALHEEDPSLSRGGAMHEGAVSAALGLGGIPSVSESTMVARDAALAGYEDARVHFQHLSCAASVRGGRGRQGSAAARVSAEVTPAPPAAHRRGRARPRHAHEDEPAAARARTTAWRSIEGLRDGTIDCVATDHAPHARDEKEVPVRAGADGHDRPGDRVRRALHRARAARRARARAARGADDRRRRAVRAAGARDRGRRAARTSR